MRGTGADDRAPRLLVLTNMWPTPDAPARGSFVFEQVQWVRRLVPAWNIDVMVIEGWKGKLEYVRGMGRLRRRVRSEPYDLIHAHYGLTGAVAVSQARTPVVVTLHGSDVHVSWQRWITRIAVARAERVIFVSERLRARLRPGTRCRDAIVPCGTDLERFRPIEREEARRRLELPDDAAVILFAGDPDRPVKNYPLFQAALASLPDEWRGRVRTLVLRQVPPEEVPYRINSADVVVVTSSYEGAGSVAKEAVACNVPVVAVAVGDIPELLAGLDGCHVVERDVEELAAAILNVLERGQRIDGRRRIRQLGVDAERVAERVVAIYRDVLEDRP